MNQYLVKGQCYCLNEEVAPHNWSALFDGSDASLKSNTDEQLLLHLSLNHTVKLSSIRLTVPEDEACPCTINLYVNKTSMGFDDAAGNSALTRFFCSTVMILTDFLIITSLFLNVYKIQIIHLSKWSN